jgi:hypothetical protein
VRCELLPNVSDTRTGANCSRIRSRTGRSGPVGAVRGSVDACAQTCRRAHPGRVHPSWAVPKAGRPRGDRLRREGTDLGRRGPCERRAGDRARAARIPGQPLDLHSLNNQLNRHGISARPARNGALAALASDLPAAVLADLLGIHINTAVRWVTYARQDWTAYLAARDADLTPAPDGPKEPGEDERDTTA